MVIFHSFLYVYQAGYLCGEVSKYRSVWATMAQNKVRSRSDDQLEWIDFHPTEISTILTHAGSGWCWYINANMTGVYGWDPWHTINIAAPWILWDMEHLLKLQTHLPHITLYRYT